MTNSLTNNRLRMENRILLYIMVGIVAIFAVFILTTFEYRDVPNNTRNGYYSLESKEPSGLWMFTQLLQSNFPDKMIDTVGMDELGDRQNSTLIAVHQDIRINKSRDSIMAFVANGNQAILSSHKYYSFGQDSASVGPDYIRDSTFYDEYYQSYDTQFVIQYLSPPFPEITTDTFVSDRIKYFSQYYGGQVVISLESGQAVCSEFDFGNGTILFHTMPQLFLNKNIKKDEGLRHVHKMLSLVKHDTLLVYDPSTYKISREQAESYLSFIFSEPSLKAAYFLTIAGLLVFLLFNSKRVQREIPILPKNRNTLQEYVNTLTELNYSQKDHSYMVSIMEKNFYHQMYKSFYVEVKDEDYVEKLSKKSKVPKQQLEVIIRRFGEAKEHAFSSDQLAALYNRIQNVYSIIGNL